MIVIQAPLRVSLFGGGTDFPSYFMKEGGCVLSSTIDKYIFVTIKKRFDQMLRVGYTQTEMVDNLDEIQHELIREALRKTGIKEGVEVTTMGDIPSEGSGLGSSSAVTVGALQAMHTYLGETVPSDQLAREACEIEIDILEKPIGVQDQYISAFGGLRYIEFTSCGQVIVDEVVLNSENRRRINDNFLLFFTGITRRSEDILTEQKANISDRLSILQEMKYLTGLARKELEAGNLDELGHMLHYSWTLKKRLASRISFNEIDEMYNVARDAGALGGKITGAGGGGFLLLYCPKEKQESVRSSLGTLQELPFLLEKDGSKVIFNYQRLSENGLSIAHSRQSTSSLPTRIIHPRPEIRVQEDSHERKDRPNYARNYVKALQYTIDDLPFSEINHIVEILHSARMDRKQVFIVGNGGSASTASHFACDLGKNTKQDGIPHFRAMALTDNMAMFSAYANDDGYDRVFVEQLHNFSLPEDILIAISTSGNSKNVIEVVGYANEKGLLTIGFTGFDGGELGNLVDVNIHVRSDCVEHVEDVHLMLEHMIVQSLRSATTKELTIVEPQEAVISDEQGQEVLALTKKGDLAQFGETRATLEDTDQVGLIFAINRELAREPSSEDIFGRILQLSVDCLGATSGSIFVVEENDTVTDCQVSYAGELMDRSPDQLDDILDHGLAGWVLKHKEATLVTSTHEDPRWIQRSWGLSQDDPRSAVSIPLMVGESVVGVMTLTHKDASRFKTQDLTLLLAISYCVSIHGERINHGSDR